jgi:hypothetical protein
MNMNCLSELDESQLVDAEGVAHYHMMTGTVNWAIALGRYNILHAVSALSNEHTLIVLPHSSSNGGLIIPACSTSIELHVTAHGNHKTVGVKSFHHHKIPSSIKPSQLHAQLLVTIVAGSTPIPSSLMGQEDEDIRRSPLVHLHHIAEPCHLVLHPLHPLLA